VTERGVALWDFHTQMRRLALGHGTVPFDAVARFAREAAPGVWALWVDEEAGLRVEPRPGTRLRDGMPVRYLPSPLDSGAGQIPKPLPPGPYAPLRLDGTATLLTSPDGTEIYESCSAAVLGWDGSHVVCAPADRPRVWSTAEAAIREHFGALARVCEAPIPPRGMPLLLVNAVKGTCTVAAPGCGEFPASIRIEIEDLFGSLTRRPG
jgi:hypothetical protein